jgi:hypothetical protein
MHEWVHRFDAALDKRSRLHTIQLSFQCSPKLRFSVGDPWLLSRVSNATSPKPRALAHLDRLRNFAETVCG